MAIYLHPRKQTWNVKMSPSKRKRYLQTTVFFGGWWGCFFFFFRGSMFVSRWYLILVMLVLFACFSLRHVFSVAKSKHNHILSNTHWHTQTQTQCFVRCSVLRYVKVLWFHCYFLRKIWHVVLFPTSNWNLYFEGTFAVFYMSFLFFTVFTCHFHLSREKAHLFSSPTPGWTMNMSFMWGVGHFPGITPTSSPEEKNETTKNTWRFCSWPFLGCLSVKWPPTIRNQVGSWLLESPGIDSLEVTHERTDVCCTSVPGCIPPTTRSMLAPKGGFKYWFI